MLSYLAWALIFSVFVNIVMFAIAWQLRTDKLTDLSYAATFLMVTATGLWQLPLTPYRVGLAAMVGLWAIRLGGFLGLRIFITGRDKRFDTIRRSFWKFAKFWIGQGISVWAILLPTLLALRYPDTPLGWLAFVGAGIWLLGLVTEAVADWQKFYFTFLPANEGKWIDRGLWRYSRHPNYFGEITVWIGVFVTACAALPWAQLLLGALSPLYIAGLLLFVTGIPILEKSADARWGDNPKYRKYKARTSLLIPRPLRRS